MLISESEMPRLYWTLGLVVIVPLLSVLLLELEQKLHRRHSPFRAVFRWIRTLFIPLFASWLAIVNIAGYELTADLPKIVATLADIAGIVVGLSFINAILFSNVAEDSWQARTPRLLVDIVRLFLVLIGVAIVLALVWGVDLGQVAAALGIGSIVIGLAIAEPLGNVFAGLMLLIERPIAVGDWIKIGDDTGQVIEINWRAVHLRTFVRNLIVVPNSTLAKESFANYSRPTRLHSENITLGFSYDDPPNKVRLILLDLLESTPGILSDPPPAVRVANYADFAVEYKVVFFVADFSKLGPIRDSFMTRVWYAAKREGITIPFPTATEIGYEPKDIEEKARPPIESTIDSLSIFRSLSDEQLSSLKSQTTWRDFARGEVIVSSGSRLTGLYVLASGRVTVSQKDESGNDSDWFEVNPGDIFGESIANGGLTSEYTATANQDTQCLVIDPDFFRKLLFNSPRFSREIARISEMRSESQHSH
ncbi:MAG: mechanosensitive ion channel domain-containing protein, partial [bacterium]